jgi:DNA-binding NarL/FixJ family response regulator
MYPPSQYVPYVRRAGAQGFVGKEADEKSLLGAIRRILRGQTSFPDLPPGQSRGASRSIPPVAGLSTRENAVLRGLLLGTPLVEIAEELGISPQSVTTYRRRILDKLEVDSNAELIRLMNLPD